MTVLNFEKPILIDLPMPIVTDRMVIREPRFGDGAVIHKAKIETWDMLNQWMPWAKKLGTVEDDEIVMREAHIKFLQKSDLMMVAFDKKTGQLLGGTGLHRFDWDTRIIEIGYWYRKSVHGQGYATEGTKALIRYAFDVLNANKVIIAHAHGNDASKRVIEKAGFELEYIAKKDVQLPNGEFVDHPFYSLFNANHLKDFNVTWGENHDQYSI
jgi:RimJ/RimL family protein N-acetyltransferase